MKMARNRAESVFADAPVCTLALGEPLPVARERVRTAALVAASEER
jgi:hypothetical protein